MIHGYDNIQMFSRKNVFDTEQKMYKKLLQCPVLGLGGVIIACLAKSRANLLWKKTGLCECGHFMDLYPSLKIRTYLDIKHLHTAWVTDAARFHGG
jgi:hypothetical protein